MKRVAGISLGSSKRDAVSKIEILGEEFEISRKGTDGDMKRFAELMSELDGKVDAIGLGGTDRYLWTDKRRYTVRDADKLARIAKTTPVVDGSGVKHTLERKMIQYLQDERIVDFANSKVLVVSAVDRFGMAQKIAELGREIVFGDLMFALNVPIPMRSYSVLRVVAATFLPLVCRLPFKWIYPTGKEQETTKPRYEQYYAWADVIAGDWHLIKKNLPDAGSGILKGKIIVTNTITAEDRQMLMDRGVWLLATAMPQYGGRNFGTNVLEGVMVTLLGKKPDELTVEDYDRLLHEMEWKPTVVRLVDSY